MSGYAHVALLDVPPLGPKKPGEPEWLPIRHHLGIQAFGVNGWHAREAGQEVIEEHAETDPDCCASHEELYLVVRGGARFSVDGDEVDAPAGTLVFVSPGLVRRAVATEPATTVLAVGAARGEAFSVSPWERRHLRREGRP